MPVGLHSGQVWRNSIFSLFPSLVDIYPELLLRGQRKKKEDKNQQAEGVTYAAGGF